MATRRKPLIVIDPSKLGPAMQRLPNDMWRAAAVARFHVKTNTEAARLAGFGKGRPPANAKWTAYEIFHDPRMLEALHELGEQYLKEGVPDAITVVKEIMGDEKHKDRLAAAKLFIDRAHPQVSLSEVTVKHKVDYTKDALEEIVAFRKLGVSRERLEQIYGRDGLWHLEQQLDASKPKVIEGEFHSVEDPDGR
jgi:phage terminase small subunit